MTTSGGEFAQPPKVVGGAGRETLTVRLRLSREMTRGPVMGKKLLLRLQLDDGVGKDAAGSKVRTRFNDAVSKGATSSSESFSFLVLLGYVPAVGERLGDTRFSVRPPAPFRGEAIVDGGRKEQSWPFHHVQRVPTPIGSS